MLEGHFIQKGIPHIFSPRKVSKEVEGYCDFSRIVFQVRIDPHCIVLVFLKIAGDDIALEGEFFFL